MNPAWLAVKATVVTEPAIFAVTVAVPEFLLIKYFVSPIILPAASVIAKADPLLKIVNGKVVEQAPFEVRVSALFTSLLAIETAPVPLA